MEKPLVSGRWTLAERIESNGERHYVAFENEAQTWAARALTAIEASVVFGREDAHAAVGTCITPASQAGGSLVEIRPLHRKINIAQLIQLFVRDEHAEVRLALGRFSRRSCIRGAGETLGR